MLLHDGTDTRNHGRKYADPISVVMESAFMNGTYDDAIGTVDHVGHWFRIGRRITMTDGGGFVGTLRFASVAEAEAEMDQLRLWAEIDY